MPRAGQNCSACRREFEADEEFRAHLYESAERYERRDFCITCEAPPLPFALATWRARAVSAAQRKSIPFDRESIFAFFRQLEPDSPEKVQLRFVLALLL